MLTQQRICIMGHGDVGRWGITGMVLAVPITAVMRIRLAHIQHPLPQFVAAVLVGQTEPQLPPADADVEGGVSRAAVGPMTPIGSSGSKAKGSLEHKGLLAHGETAGWVSGGNPDIEMQPAAETSRPGEQAGGAEAPGHHHAL